MTTYLIVLAVFLLAFAGMAIGVILSNRRIKGSCGGIAGLQDEHGATLCESCTTPKTDCRENALRPQAENEPSSAAGR